MCRHGTKRNLPTAYVRFSALRLGASSPCSMHVSLHVVATHTVTCNDRLLHVKKEPTCLSYHQEQRETDETISM